VWRGGTARRAAFLMQTCAVDVVYAHAWARRIPSPPVRPEVLSELAGLPAQLEVADLPTFLVDTNYAPSFRELLVNQFLGLDTADHVLVTSFYDLEPQVSATMIQTKNDMFWHCIICKVLHNALILLGRGLLGVYLGAKTVGPTVP
jgi:pathogen-inducible salicylic acid glucosyltransferase